MRLVMNKYRVLAYTISLAIVMIPNANFADVGVDVLEQLLRDPDRATELFKGLSSRAEKWRCTPMVKYSCTTQGCQKVPSEV